MANDVDLVVIGSGFGGLTAAALAARDGLRVKVFEHHTRPGGCAGDFALGGFWFPAGATVVTGLEPGGILRQVFDRMGAEIETRPMNPSIIFHVEGRRFAYTADVDTWKEQLSAAFPASAQRYERFWDWTHDAGGRVYRIGAALPSFPLERWSDVRRSLRAASWSAAAAMPDLLRTVGSVKRRLGARGEPAIDAMIDSLLMDATGAAAAECSAVQGAIALDLYRRGCQWVPGGTGRLAMLLVREIRRHAGSVDFGAEVTRLERSDCGWRVTLANGDETTAGTVVANVPPAALARLRGKRPVLPQAGSAWSAFVLHLGIDATGLPAMHPFHQVVRAGESHGNTFVSIFPSTKRDAARWSLSVSRHVEARDWQTFDAAKERRRTEMEEQLLRDVTTVIPDVRERVLMCRSATPRTYERFTLRPGGFVGGLVQRPGAVVFRAPGHRPERGLFMAGDHVFPGQGTVGTALSGINAYRDAVEFLGGRAAL